MHATPKLLSFSLALTAACMGEVGPRASGGAAARPPGGAAPIGPVDQEGRAACTGAVQPGPAYLRRLANDEYARAVAEALALPAADAASATATTLVSEGFGNTAAALHVTTSHLERYLAAAQRLATMAVTTPERRTALAGCDAVGTDPCLTAMIEAVGRRAFRRTLTDAEVARIRTLAAVASADPEPTMPARIALQGILLSTKFLYRVETGGPPGKNGWRRLSGPELAARLSFFLWGGAPDQPLLAAAESGALDSAVGVRARAAEMLDSPRARAGVARALSAWLQLHDLDSVARAPAQYPLWSEALRGSMREETRRFLDDFVWPADASLLDALDAPYSYVDANLARVYGLPAPSGWEKRSFAASDPRGGLLTQAAILTLPVSGTEVTAAILRGKYVRDTLLCTPPAPPPPDIPPLPADPDLTTRERLAQHRSNPACVACHDLLDPVGLAFEQYDGIGVHRDKGPRGEPLTGEGQIVGIPGAPVVRGAKELSARLRELPQVGSCAVTHLFSFAYGRELLVSDACAREEARAALEASGGSFRALISALVASDAFRHVRDTTGGAP